MLFFFIFLCKYVLYSSVHRHGYIRRIDIDNLKVYIVLFISLSLNVSNAILFTFWILQLYFLLW